jgi:hypothetical protein
MATAGPDGRPEAKPLLIGCTGVSDYIERTPPDDELDELVELSARFDLPVRAGGWFYRLGSDEALFEQNIEKARILGSLMHNVQVFTDHADGYLLSDDEVAACYKRANDFALRRGVTPCFEVHVNMWSEHFGRGERVADLVRRPGVPFRLTFDVSHVVFKIGNPEELAVQDLQADVAAGRTELDPCKPNVVAQRWIDACLVHHGHARGAVPANPRNRRARHPDGSLGRGIQYPFERPSTGAGRTTSRSGIAEPAWRAVFDGQAFGECSVIYNGLKMAVRRTCSFPFPTVSLPCHCRS